MKLTNTEKALLGLMFENFNNIIKFADNDYIEVDGKPFNSNDLFEFAEKLGISDYL
jgi:hypothetical protein